LAGDGRGSNGVRLIQPPPLLVILAKPEGFAPDVRVARQALVELDQCRAHLLSKAVDERTSIEWQAERLVVAGALRVEVDRQVLVGIAVAVRARHPDLLVRRASRFDAAQLVAQRLQGVDLVGDAVDARPSLRVLVHNGVAPQWADDAVQWHVKAGNNETPGFGS